MSGLIKKGSVVVYDNGDKLAFTWMRWLCFCDCLDELFLLHGRGSEAFFSHVFSYDVECAIIV